MNGDTVKVVTTGDTQIQISQEGTLADLSKGSSVVVLGSSTNQGVLKATRVTEGDLGAGGPLDGASSSPGS